MGETINFGLYDNVKIESIKYKEFDCSVVHIGITGFCDLYSDKASFKIIVIDEEDDFELIEEIVIYTNKYMSEDGMHYLWHESIVPWLSKKYDCSKYIYDTYELINILYPSTDEELDEL